jgi:hypothetical protein
MRHSFSPVFMRVGNRPALADRRRQIRHGLATHPGDVAGDLGGRLHEEVAQGAGDLDIVFPMLWLGFGFLFFTPPLQQEGWDIYFPR